VVMPPPQHTLVQSIDTQVADVHFPATAPAHLIAQRALRCAASDLAAMGATPQGFFLALTLPRTQHSASRNKPTSRQHNQQTGQQERLDWLEQFADGLRDAAHACQLSLLGGDTTSGNELVVSCLVQGWLPANNTGLLRSGAQPGDQVWVSGELGRGALALPQVLKNPAHSQGFAQHYYFPEPRLAADRQKCPWRMWPSTFLTVCCKTLDTSPVPAMSVFSYWASAFQQQWLWGIPTGQPA